MEPKKLVLVADTAIAVVFAAIVVISAYEVFACSRWWHAYTLIVSSIVVVTMIWDIVTEIKEKE